MLGKICFQMHKVEHLLSCVDVIKADGDDAILSMLLRLTSVFSSAGPSIVWPEYKALHSAARVEASHDHSSL